MTPNELITSSPETIHVHPLLSACVWLLCRCVKFLWVCLCVSVFVCACFCLCTCSARDVLAYDPEPTLIWCFMPLILLFVVSVWACWRPYWKTLCFAPLNFLHCRLSTTIETVYPAVYLMVCKRTRVKREATISNHEALVRKWPFVEDRYSFNYYLQTNQKEVSELCEAVPIRWTSLDLRSRKQFAPNLQVIWWI